MSKVVRERLLKTVELLEQGTKTACENDRKMAIEDCLALLSDCQELAIAFGTKIESLHGQGTPTVSALEEYCEVTYQCSEQLIQGMACVDSVALMTSFHQVKEVFFKEFPDKKEIVFLPYKASMWDSLESVWRKADEDPECEAYVVPIPYYDKTPDGSFGEFHYEGDLYPKDVPIVSYKDYNLEEHHPDEIYIHNPYDEYNIVTSVDPDFYSSKIKDYTEKLVYIPYFVLAEPEPKNEECVKGISHFIQVPAVINAHQVIVQSEAMREVYIKVMTKMTGEDTREQWEKKILGTGSPKFDKVANTKVNDEDIPEEWKKVIYKTDGTRKKVVLYNTSVTALLENSDRYLTKMRDVFDTFKEYEKDVALLWRPHPLIQATISSMRPKLWEEYQKIMVDYRNAGWGIYDDSTELDRAIVLSDAYYGDLSSVVQLCQKVKMPVMVQNTSVLRD